MKEGVFRAGNGAPPGRSEKDVAFSPVAGLDGRTRALPSCSRHPGQPSARSAAADAQKCGGYRRAVRRRNAEFAGLLVLQEQLACSLTRNSRTSPPELVMMPTMKPAILLFLRKSG